MNVLTACAKVLVLLLPALAFAEEATPGILKTDPMASFGKVFIFLIVVLGMIAGLAWLINKTRIGQIAGQSKQLRMLAVMPIGTKEKIAIIEAGDQQLVVGITAQQITTLSVLNNKIEMEHENATSFSEILKMAVRK